MARDRSRRAREREEDDAKGGLRGLLRDILIAIAIVVVIFAGIFAYTQVYPPLVVVESSSMQHGDDVSSIGVIDTGDLVLVQAAPTRSAIVTWIEGRVTGYETYGDFGDVIVFRKPTVPTDPTPVIHRAIMYVVPNGTDAYDVPDLRNLPSSQWEGIRRGGAPVQGEPLALERVTIHGMGWQRNLGIAFDLLAFAQNPALRSRSGYITMGDNNAYNSCTTSLDPCEPFRPYDQGWIVPHGNVIGRARGEIPWFGLLKLTLDPGKSSGKCCDGWGDPRAPRNSWDSLAIALPLVFGSPFLVEAAFWAWGKYVAPRIRRRPSPDTEAAAEADPEDPR